MLSGIYVSEQHTWQKDSPIKVTLTVLDKSAVLLVNLSIEAAFPGSSFEVWSGD